MQYERNQTLQCNKYLHIVKALIGSVSGGASNEHLNKIFENNLCLDSTTTCTI